jgi:hypothetical protein
MYSAVSSTSVLLEAPNSCKTYREGKALPHLALTQYILHQNILIHTKEVTGKLIPQNPFGNIFNNSQQPNIPGHIVKRRLFLKKAFT